MLYLPLSKFSDSAETVVAPGAVISAEGQALVRAVGAPASGVQPSMAANANEQFVGFAFAGLSAAPLAALYANKVETLVVPFSGKVALEFTPVAGQVFAFDFTAGAVVASPTITANQIGGLTSGHTVQITYKYALTVIQSRALQGDIQPGGYAGAYVGQIGLIKRGVVYTSEFNASVNWSAATAIKLAPNGQLTDQSGTGAIINGYVVSVPGEEVPYLGLEFSAA
jgi:hypothetical protein